MDETLNLTASRLQRNVVMQSRHLHRTLIQRTSVSAVEHASPSAAVIDEGHWMYTQAFLQL